VTRARVVAQALHLLGAVDGPIALAGRTGTIPNVHVARDDEPAAAALCVFLGEPADPTSRQARLAALSKRLGPGAPLVVVDHNQPRTRWRRAIGTAALALHGFTPSRARYPVALEVHDEGYAIACLRLTANERIQLILARRR
jgi:hypothetical protein